MWVRKELLFLNTLTLANILVRSWKHGRITHLKSIYNIKQSLRPNEKQNIVKEGKCQVNVSSGNKSTKQKEKKKEKRKKIVKRMKSNFTTYNQLQQRNGIFFSLIFSHISYWIPMLTRISLHPIQHHIPSSIVTFHTISYTHRKTLRHNANKFKVGEQGTIYDILRWHVYEP